MRPRLGTSLHLPSLVLVLVLTCLVAGCGEDQEKKTLPEPGSSATASPSPTPASRAVFSMPAPGDAIGDDVTARPPGEESAQSAGEFAAWALSLLLHTPREDASVRPWSQAAGPGCEPCRRAVSVWQQQRTDGQVFLYAGVPEFTRTVARPQPRGGDWFVHFEVAVPRSELRESGRLVQATEPEDLGYTFTVTWVDDAWQIEDFHVLS